MKTEKETQISAVISRTTKSLLESRVRQSGIKKGHLLEEALLHHLRALQELPMDVIVHPRIVLSQSSGKELLERLASPENPTKDLVDLMGSGGD
jgi:hypothetical protein